MKVRSTLLGLSIATFFCLSAGEVAARSPQGVRVTVPGESVTVYLDGEQVSGPASSCFIARVKCGDHRIEVRNSCGEVIYNEMIRCRKNQVEQIRLASRTGKAKQLDKKKFDEMLRMIEQESFGEGKNAILSMVVGVNGLSTEQIRRVLASYSFDENKLEALKMCYPSVIDPENYYTLASVFTFASSKKKMAAFLQKTR
ncbi:MAG TPA: DUF4476 domain-containing protein [Candidatus Alistipes merdigallinarum]|nr:DUF4476 domain-containing protein [Candidatus Alistipes merdigallinarum]